MRVAELGSSVNILLLADHYAQLIKTRATFVGDRSIFPEHFPLYEKMPKPLDCLQCLQAAGIRYRPSTVPSSIERDFGLVHRYVPESQGRLEFRFRCLQSGYNEWLQRGRSLLTSMGLNP